MVNSQWRWTQKLAGMLPVVFLEVRLVILLKMNLGDVVAIVGL